MTTTPIVDVLVITGSPTKPEAKWLNLSEMPEAYHEDAVELCPLEHEGQVYAVWLSVEYMQDVPDLDSIMRIARQFLAERSSLI